MLKPHLYRANLKEIIDALGLGDGLACCYDFGESDCYSGSGQTVTDLSGNGLTLNLGATSGAEASDPTFNGVAGALSENEYFSFDGGDYFTLASANPTDINDLHKNNADLMLFAIDQIGALSTSQRMFGTNAGSTSNIGVEWGFGGTNSHIFSCTNGTGSYARDSSSSGTGIAATGVWNHHAWYVDEAANSRYGIRNFSSASGASSYTAPSAAAATYAFNLGADGNGHKPLTNGSKLAMFALWSTGNGINRSRLLSLIAMTRARFDMEI